MPMRLSLPRGIEMSREKSAEGIVGISQAMLVRHSKAERRSKQIGGAATGILKARTRVEGEVLRCASHLCG